MSNNLAITLKLDANGNLVGVVNQATGSVAKFGETVNGVTAKTKALGIEGEKAFGKTHAGVQSVSEQIANTKAQLIGWLVLMGSIDQLSGLVKTADAYKAMQSQLRLVTESTQEFIAVQQQLNAVSIASFADQGAVTKLYSTMQPALEGMGKSINEVIAFTETFNKALSLTSPTTAEAQSAVLQFAQAMGSGVLRGDEFNSLMENGRGVMIALAEGMGKPIGELRVMAEQGKLTADVVYNALTKVSDRIDADFNKVAMTVGKALQTVQTGSLNLVGAFDAASGSSATLAAAINSTGLAFNRIGDAIRQAYGESDNAGQRFQVLESIILNLARGGGFVAAVFNEITNQIGLVVAIVASAGDSGVKLADVFKAYQEAASKNGQAFEKFNNELAYSVDNINNVAAAAGNSIPRLKSIDEELADIFGTLDKTLPPVEIKTKVDEKTLKEAEKKLKERLKAISASQSADYNHFESNLGLEAAYAKKIADQGKAIYDATRTGYEKLNIELSNLDQLYAQGAFDNVGGFDTYSRAIMDAYDKANASGKEFTDAQAENMRDLKQAIDGWGKDSARAVADFALSGKGSFSDFANSVVKDLMTMMIYQNMTKPLMKAAGNWIGSLFSGGVADAGASSAASIGASYWKNGGAFTPSVQAFANGGTFTNSIVDRATPFQFANGGKFNLGVMGEAGAEAVMPLTRIGGKLGVLAQGVGGGGVTNVVVNVTNNAGETVQANARQSTNSNGETIIDVMIDRVKGAMMQDVGNNGQFSQAFAGAYGLSRRAF